MEPEMGRTEPADRNDQIIVIDDHLLSVERVRDPYPYFRQLQEHDPVRWNERYRSWVITRYDDVAACFRDLRLSSDRITPYRANRDGGERHELSQVLDVLSGWLVFKDPPDHTRLRRLVQKAFTVKTVERWRGRIQEVVDELIDELTPESTTDIVREFAYPLPAIVIAEMLGVPPSDRDLFKGWSDDITALVFGAMDEPDRHERAAAGMAELVSYLSGLLEEHQHSEADDLMGSLVAARDDDDALTADEVLATCVLLLFGGHETTSSLIGSSVHALVHHPDQLHDLMTDPTIIGPAIEEFLRFDGPAKVSVRMVRESFELQGRKIRSGERVFLVPSAANRDPRRFRDPDRLDLRRDDHAHLGFGGGIHYCLGAPLARVEAGIAISSLIRRLPGLSIPDPASLQWQPTLLSRSLRSLPVAFDRVEPAP